MGLQGMINDLVERSDFPTGNKLKMKSVEFKNQQPLQNCGASKA
jgi:methylmalonyl-CoA mutase